jgi:hypothetical protein
MGQTASAIQMGRFETKWLLRLRIAPLEGRLSSWMLNAGSWNVG